jgi:hypothetical protein
MIEIEDICIGAILLCGVVVATVMLIIAFSNIG